MKPILTILILLSLVSAQAATVYVSTTGNDTTAVRGNPALPALTLTNAFALSQSGDTVQMGTGTFPLLANSLYIDNRTLTGAGPASSFITGSAGSLLILAGPATLSGFTITATDIGGSNFPVEAGFTNPAPPSVTMSNVSVFGKSDGISIWGTNAITFHAVACSFTTAYDAVIFSSTNKASTFSLESCTISVDKDPFLYGSIMHGMTVAGGPTVRVIDTTITVQNATATTRAIWNLAGDIYLRGSTISASSGSGTVFNVEQLAGSTSYQGTIGAPNLFTGGTSGAATLVDSGTGLVIAFDVLGRLVDVKVNGTYVPFNGAGGFAAKDFASGSSYFASAQTITPIVDGVALLGSVPGFNLDLAATITTSSGNIAIVGSVTNTAGGNRAIGLRFALPVDLSGWTWFDDPVVTRGISTSTVYSNAVACSFGRERRSLYPLATLGTNAASLTTAVPIGIPQPFLLSYDHTTKQLCFDTFLGLTASAGKYVASGEFSFVLYSGTNGGFREALQHYYATYPAAFTRRQPWEAPYNYGNNEIFNRTTHTLNVFPLSYTNMSDFGEGLDFITSLHGVSYDATWATNSPVRPSDALLRSWLSVQPAGSQYPGSDAELQLATDSSGAVRYITSVYTPSVPQWFFELMVNQDPEITSGLTTKVSGLLATYYAVAHPAWGSTITSDFAEGGAGSVHLDFYPAHLAVADLTPTFDSVTFAPAMFSQLWDFYDDYLAPAVVTRSFLFMGNSGAPDDLYTAPYIDIGMSEGYRTADEYRFYRMLSYHKAWRNWRTTDNAQPYTQAIFQAELDACLAQGIYPSLGILSTDGVLEAFRPYYRTYIPVIEELSSAGWEPFTHATATMGAIPERFGTFAADTLCFSVANPTSSTISTTVTMDTAALGAAPASWTCIDLLSKGNVTVSGGTFTITLTPGQTRAFWIGDSAREWHRAAILAQMYIDRISRSFAPDLSAGDLARIATLTASLAAVNSNASLAAARPTLNSEVDAIVSHMVTAGTGDLRNLATHIKSLLGLSGSFTPASVSAFIIQVRSGL